MTALLALLLVMASPGRASDRAVFTVAVDPGHGGTNLGASGLEPGAYEKRVTLALARRLATRLRGNRRVRVVLCRQKDELVAIRARVRCANDSGADLFVSLHANASPLGRDRGSQRGFELYVLPVEEADRVAALAAARADSAAEAAWQASRVRTLVEASLEAAKRIQLELADALGQDRDRGVKQDGAALDVLHGLAMPGVLIEVGFIDHPEEGLELLSGDGQDRIARALARVISDLAARAQRAASDPHITDG